MIATEETLIPHLTHNKSHTYFLQEDYQYIWGSTREPNLCSVKIQREIWSMLWFCHRLQHAERCLNQHRKLVLNQNFFVTQSFAKQPAINKQNTFISSITLPHASREESTIHRLAWLPEHTNTHTHTHMQHAGIVQIYLSFYRMLKINSCISKSYEKRIFIIWFLGSVV